MSKIIDAAKRIIHAVTNEINAAVGYQQSFVELLDAGDVTRAIGMMENRSKSAVENLLQYNAETHKVMSRPDKPIYDKNGNFLRNKPVNRVSIPYHKFINEVALVFMYGRPVLWENATAGSDPKTDEKFARLTKQLSDCHFDSHLREAKRYAGCEGCSAMLFHTYQENNEPKMLIRVLSKTNNDDIYTMFDQYKRLVAFAWGYTTLDSDNDSIRHFDIYTKDSVYICQNGKRGLWSVEKRPNLVGKIPAIVFIQEVEWDGVQSIIDRIEDAYSKNADTNDNFGDPALVATADIVNTLPKQEEESKLYVLRNGGDIKYLERSNTNEARQTEIDALDEQAMNKSFTPNITIEELKGLQNASGETLKQVMLLATIKAEKRKETHDGYMSRVSSLMCTIMGNVLDVSSGGYDDLQIVHKFQDPFGSNLTSILTDAIKQYSAGALSMESLLDLSYLVTNTEKEKERINEDQQREDERRRSASLMDALEPTL